jgi:hypothetical protein
MIGGRHAARIFSRAAVRGARIATGAPHGFGTRALALQLSERTFGGRTTSHQIEKCVEPTSIFAVARP